MIISDVGLITLLLNPIIEFNDKLDIFLLECIG